MRVLNTTKAVSSAQLSSPRLKQRQQLEAQLQASLSARTVAQAVENIRVMYERDCQDGAGVAGGSSSQPGNGENGGPGGVMVPGGQPFVGARGSSSQPGNGGSGGEGGVMGPGVQPLTAPQHQSSNGGSGEDQSSQFMKEKPPSVSSMSPQNRKRDRDSKEPTPIKKQRNDKLLGTCEGPATRTAERAFKKKSITNIIIIGTQKGKFRDKLFKVVEMFFGMSEDAKECLTEEMISKNLKLKRNIDIITGKKNKEIGSRSTDEMASAFKEFRECYTNVKRHLLTNNPSIITSLHKLVQTFTEIDAEISTMLEHDIIQFQEIKQDFKYKVEEYKSLGFTLPTKEVAEINRYEYTSGANLTAFKTLVDEKIKKLKDLYVEKMKAKLCEDVVGYLETDIVSKELNSKLDSVKTQSLEEIKNVIEAQEAYIDRLRIGGKLTVGTDKSQQITGGLTPIGTNFESLTEDDLNTFGV